VDRNTYLFTISDPGIKPLREFEDEHNIEFSRLRFLSSL